MTTPYMQSMFNAQEIVAVLTDDDGANVRIIAKALTEHAKNPTKSPSEWSGFEVCKKCGFVSIAHPIKRCSNFVSKEEK